MTTDKGKTMRASLLASVLAIAGLGLAACASSTPHDLAGSIPSVTAASTKRPTVPTTDPFSIVETSCDVGRIPTYRAGVVTGWQVVRGTWEVLPGGVGGIFCRTVPPSYPWVSSLDPSPFPVVGSPCHLTSTSDAPAAKVHGGRAATGIWRVTHTIRTTVFTCAAPKG
ncbi:MAG: hypothetical protein ACYCST_04530 [Acidimicrobiales bacterium]